MLLPHLKLLNMQNEASFFIRAKDNEIYFSYFTGSAARKRTACRPNASFAVIGRLLLAACFAPCLQLRPFCKSEGRTLPWKVPALDRPFFAAYSKIKAWFYRGQSKNPWKIHKRKSVKKHKKSICLLEELWGRQGRTAWAMPIDGIWHDQAVQEKHESLRMAVSLNRRVQTEWLSCYQNHTEGLPLIKNGRIKFSMR